ncbi:MAG TPA: CRTAC1 family protein, partial [Candidatus Polarisedimenticolia bacterium]|nr:CRTAC1 family protein [Candidatus Polarisedimenticolia bacterium]
AGWGGVENLLFVNATPPPAANAPAGQGPVVFVESAARARVGGGGRRSTGAIFADFDNDRDIDFALASLSGGTTLFSNLRDGTFGDLQAGSGLPSSAPILALAAGDYNKDGWMDLAASTWEGGLPRLFRNMGGEPSGRPGSSPGAGQFAADVPALAAVSRQIASPQFGLVFLDFDNDGYLDLAAVNGGDLGPAVFLLRNEGEGRFADATALTGLDGVTARGGRGLAAADLDQDGDLDLVVSNNGGRPTLLRNDGGSRNHWLRVAPAGRHSNRPGVGAKVEVKSGRLWQKAEITAGSGYLSQSPPVAHFGLGSRERVDTVRVLWPGGVLQDEVQVTADAVFAVQELDRKGSSCPILYAWNGAAFEFVSDFLGGSAIGYRTGPESFNVPDTDEYVLIPGDRLSARDGRLLIRMVNQLEETIYFDRARLLAVDHPAAIEIFPDEKLMPGPPFPGFRVFSVAESRPVIAARDGSGRDLLQALERVDRVYAEPPPMPGSRAFKGYAPEHEVTLDLGPLEPGAPVLLLLHGWIDYADSTSNLAASQAGLTLVPPSLEAYEASTGSWKRVVPRMGFPAGLPKTMTVDLTDALPPGSRLVRIRTSMRIYWDRIRVATAYGSAPSMTAMEAASADLRYRGFPALVTPDGRAPEVYDYSRDQEPIHWKSHVGHFTRYGDVRDLLAAVDDRYVITRPGDEIALEFPSEALPPLPPGWMRDYLLFADGFGKDMDMNSARPHTVAPLPYHAMPSYPHAGRDGYPFMTEGIMEYIDAYNTRLVPAVM